MPTVFTHGSADKVYSYKDQTTIYEALHKAKYPVKFTLFETGSHGTPVRMTGPAVTVFEGEMELA